MTKSFTIGVFDSGVGGQTVAQAVKRELPDSQIVFVSDNENMPYGDKSPEELLKVVSPIIKKLAGHVDVIVIACNTVSTTLAAELRQLVDTPIVALEPMVKPAALATKTGTIAVCATPTTLASDRYKSLKQEYAAEVEVIEPDCREWALMIEANSVQREKIKEQIDMVCERGADIIVLGCTHYHWIEEIVKQEAAGRADVLQPEQAVVSQLGRVLEQLG